MNDEGFTKSPTRGFNSLALSMSRSEKNLVGNINDEIIWKISLGHNLQTHGQKNW